MAEGQKHGRGGARVRAGRKPKMGEPRTEPLAVKLSARGAEALRRAAERTGKSRQQLINEWALTLTEEDMR